MAVQEDDGWPLPTGTDAQQHAVRPFDTLLDEAVEESAGHTGRPSPHPGPAGHPRTVRFRSWTTTPGPPSAFPGCRWCTPGAALLERSRGPVSALQVPRPVRPLVV